MLLRHYSDKPVIPISERVPDQHVNPQLKPRGLWVSVDDCDTNWVDFCKSNEFALERLTCVHEVSLKPCANEDDLLIISDSFELDEFTTEFGEQDYPDSKYPIVKIRWDVVASNWKGIIIAPYIWERRTTEHTFWYYGWDCASGCIWDTSVIKSVELIDAPKKYLIRPKQSERG